MVISQNFLHFFALFYILTFSEKYSFHKESAIQFNSNFSSRKPITDLFLKENMVADAIYSFYGIF